MPTRPLRTTWLIGNLDAAAMHRLNWLLTFAGMGDGAAWRLDCGQVTGADAAGYSALAALIEKSRALRHPIRLVRVPARLLEEMRQTLLDSMLKPIAEEFGQR